jgi:hypothetical protein
VAAAAFGASVAVWACGGVGGAGADSDADLKSFCDQSAALDALDRPPNDAELDGLLQSAPEAIKEEAETLAESAREFRAGNDSAADSPEIQEAGRRFDAFIVDNCRDS